MSECKVLEMDVWAPIVRQARQAREDEQSAIDQAATEQKRMIDGLSQRSVKALEKLSELPSDVNVEE